MNKIAILDAGSQYIKLIDKNIRELDCETDIYPLNISHEKLTGYKGIIISGGPDSVYEKNAVMCDIKIFDLNIPILGICYGMQLMNYLFGGSVVKKDVREDGQKPINIIYKSLLFQNMDMDQKVLLTHGDCVEKIATNFKITALSQTLVSAIEHNDLPIYGVQFHPEVELTENGTQLFKNFIFDICKLVPTFSLQNRLNSLINLIKTTVADKTVIVLVSGGVDSSVCLALLHKSLNRNQIYAVHIDHGFLRKKEMEVINKLNELGYNIKVLDCKNEFYNGQTTINGKLSIRLCDTIDPEHKRKIIGDTFMKVIDKYFEAINLKQEECLLVQGTLRPDLIESASKLASGKADTIKTHHNDTKLVRDMRDKGLILEPLKDLHKNEVRKLGLELGLDNDLVFRHPFPGPGLAIRIVCTPNMNHVEIKEVSAQLQSYAASIVSKQHSFQILPFKSVGVQGDCRTYSYAVSISGPYNDEIYTYALDIPQKIKKVNRVLYNINSTKYVIIGYADLCIEDINLLRDVDDCINNELGSLYSNISQMPIVLLPLATDTKKKSVVIRPITTSDFMTAKPYKMPYEFLDKIHSLVVNKFNIENVLVDLTSKPPATIEYE